MTQPFQRTLEIDGIFNFRDVGHYVTRGGRMTRPGVLYRSGAVHDLGTVRRFGVKTVLDLRGVSDVERDSKRMGTLRSHSAVERVALPLIPADVDGQSGHEFLNDRFGPGITAGRYGGYLEIGPNNVRDALQVFARPEVFPAVVHCTAGKDRTGVIIALILDVLGVDHETIIADYVLSNDSVPHLVKHLRGDEGAAVALSESDMARFGAPEPAMRGFLEQLSGEHGSARELLRKLGVAESVFDVLEAALLEPPR